MPTGPKGEKRSADVIVIATTLYSTPKPSRFGLDARPDGAPGGPASAQQNRKIAPFYC